MMVDDSDKPDEETPIPSANAPEVEAEIVTDDAAANSSANISDGFSGEDAAPSSQPTQKRKITLSPRVMIVCAGIIASIGVGFAIWRLLPGEAQPDPTADGAIQQAVPNVVETPENIPNETQTMPDQERPAPSAASKITNDIDIGSAAKEAGSDTQPRAPLPGETFLPPLPATDKIDAGNQEFQELAKETLDQLNPSGGEEIGNDIRPDAEQNETPVFAPEETGALNLEAPQADMAIVEDAGLDISETQTPEELAAPNIKADSRLAKIDNDSEVVREGFRAEIAGLKASLAQANEREATQRAEIEAMRRDFLAALQARDEQANTEIAALTARLNKVQNDNGVDASRRAAATLTLGSLQQAIDRGKPYARELKLFAGLSSNTSELALLRRFADVGAPTVTALKEDFGSIARDAMVASRIEGATGFMGKLSARAQSLISVRPAKPIAGDSAPAILSRAEEHIKYGELSACLAELEGLPASAQTAMRGWMETAQARVDIDDAIEVLYRRLLTPTN